MPRARSPNRARPKFHAEVHAHTSEVTHIKRVSPMDNGVAQSNPEEVVATDLSQSTNNYDGDGGSDEDPPAATQENDCDLRVSVFVLVGVGGPDDGNVVFEVEEGSDEAVLVTIGAEHEDAPENFLVVATQGGATSRHHATISVGRTGTAQMRPRGLDRCPDGRTRLYIRHPQKTSPGAREGDHSPPTQTP